MDTNLDKIKEISKSLLNVEIVEDIKSPIPFLVQHPFTNSAIVSDRNNHKQDGKKTSDMLNLFEKEGRKRWINNMTNVIDESNSVNKILFMINKPYRLTFLKYTKDYMSKKDFAETLAYAYTTEENPNSDVNVPVKLLIKWFKEADKKYLMTEEDYSVWKNLPEAFTVYRGVSVGRVDKGISWTRDKSEAEWFANRFGKGHILELQITKDMALAYFDIRNEKEVVVDIYAK